MAYGLQEVRNTNLGEKEDRTWNSAIKAELTIVSTYSRDRTYFSSVRNTWRSKTIEKEYISQISLYAPIIFPARLFLLFVGFLTTVDAH